MRIAHISDAYLPRLGGIETLVSGLAGHQRRAGHEVHVLTGTRSRGTREPVGPDAPVVHRGSPTGLLSDLRSGQFDVVHVHASVFSPLAMSLTVAACAADLSVALTVHSMWPGHPAIIGPAGFGLRLRHRPVAWSAVSRAAAGPLRRALGPGPAVDIVPNAVDVDWWRAAPARQREDAGRPAGEVVITSLGRLAGRKRPLPLLRVMAAVRRQVDPSVPIRLVLAGEGPQLGRVRRAVSAWGMSSWVELPGRLSPVQARDLLSRSDVYVAPADLESFGIAALEARSVGLPVVAKRASGVGEFVEHGREGLLVGSDLDMVHALTALVTDTDRRTTMAAHNAATPPSTTWDEALLRTDRLYRRAAELAERSLPMVEVPA